MIPKVIHYCWFGGNLLPELAQKCIESWKKYCPDYEIKRWNETTFDIHSNAYVEEAYEARKYAFVTDYVRLYALYHEGGVYMDTDVEVLKPLDDLLDYEAVSGFEAPSQIPTGLMASREGHPFIKELLADYDNIHFKRADGTLDMTTNVRRITDHCLQYGLQLNNMLQTINGFTLLPKDYLCPKDVNTGELNISANTYTIHHFNGSWVSEEQKLAANLRRKYSKIMPRRMAGYVAVFMAAIKTRGLKAATHQLSSWAKRKRLNKI